jgi:hypothetical protein
VHPSFRALSLEVLKSFLVALSRARDGTRDGFDFERRESLKDSFCGVSVDFFFNAGKAVEKKQNLSTKIMIAEFLLRSIDRLANEKCLASRRGYIQLR